MGPERLFWLLTRYFWAQLPNAETLLKRRHMKASDDFFDLRRSVSAAKIILNFKELY